MFDRVLNNLGRFVTAASTRPRIHVILVYVVMRQNLTEVLPFVDLARKFQPLRVEFHPVRHVKGWQVTNNTGWHFDGEDQACESFRDEYNDVMSATADRCRAEGLAHEVHLL
jgi:sulfatase maturation enzyme AslB (radical SAM superfamily)